MNFYRTFEDKHRGPQDLIKSRLKVYLPFVEIIKTIYPKALALDLGCGRGEWLELLNEHGFITQGVDLDEGMLDACRDLHLNVHKEDVLEFLKKMPNESCSIVSGFHLAEHIHFDNLKQLVKEAKRVLLPAGLLILETPNPENIIVGTSGFYLDPTHQRPLPPLLLSFLAEYYHFERAKILRLQESKENDPIDINQIFHGVSPDYAMIAQKSAAPELIALSEEVFAKEYGVTLEQLTLKYEQHLGEKLKHLEHDAQTTREAMITEQREHINTLQTINKNLTIEITQIKSQWLEKQKKYDFSHTILMHEIAQAKAELLEQQKEHDTSYKTLLDEMVQAKFELLEQQKNHTTLKYEITETKAQLLEQNTELQKAYQELHVIYNSRSWLLTRPLRKANLIYKKTSHPLKSKAKSLMRKSFLILVSWLNKYPDLKKSIVRIIDKNPKFSSKLRTIYHKHHIKNPHSFTSSNNSYENTIKNTQCNNEILAVLLKPVEEGFIIKNNQNYNIDTLNQYIVQQVEAVKEKIQHESNNE